MDVMIVGCAMNAYQGGCPARLVPERDGTSIDAPGLYHAESSAPALASAMDWNRKKRSRA